jgi:urease accessory protein
MLTATKLLPRAPFQAQDHVTLDYDARLIRRRRLTTAGGTAFMVDLPSLTNLDDHWGFELSDGTRVQVIAAEEDLIEVTGTLPRLAWHIGNRHTPCQIEQGRLLIRRDPVIEAMLLKQGATLRAVTEPFTPEGGAYGIGRTMGHSHGPGDHSHSHDSAHDHFHPHPHPHP